MRPTRHVHFVKYGGGHAVVGAVTDERERSEPLARSNVVPGLSCRHLLGDLV